MVLNSSISQHNFLLASCVPGIRPDVTCLLGPDLWLFSKAGSSWSSQLNQAERVFFFAVSSSKYQTKSVSDRRAEKERPPDANKQCQLPLDLLENSGGNAVGKEKNCLEFSCINCRAHQAGEYFAVAPEPWITA